MIDIIKRKYNGHDIYIRVRCTDIPRNFLSKFCGKHDFEFTQYHYYVPLSKLTDYRCYLHSYSPSVSDSFQYGIDVPDLRCVFRKLVDALEYAISEPGVPF